MIYRYIFVNCKFNLLNQFFACELHYSIENGLILDLFSVIVRLIDISNGD